VSLSADGSVLLAGARGQNNGEGEAYLMTRNGATWSTNPTNPTTTVMSTLLPGSIVLSTDAFGIAVGLSGDGSFASVGAALYPGGSGGGAAVTFSEGSASQWAYDANITPSGLQGVDLYGFALGVASDALTVVVGAYYAPGGLEDGAAYVSDFY